ncbi:DUF4301 family protein [Alkalibacterium iburiense]|uniref:DUF4301 family protein n=1 Tax=Alkalibacterium iburiense TaxID=290589 RepID=A0ABP3HIF8_9LACT
MEDTIEKFKKGVQYVPIASAVTKKELTPAKESDVDFNGYSMTKFIPASGAATRMFKDLYTFLEDKENTAFVNTFFDNLKSFAFYEVLESYVDLNELDTDKLEDRLLIANKLLNDMNYGDTPKVLLPFHNYGQTIKTPIEEHIYEGERYLDSENVTLHFTISKKHEDEFNTYIRKVLADKPHVSITYSHQEEDTDTMAVDLNNEPFYLDNGEILYRPGGHGALINNLNDRPEDIIFIKNIDNVTHQSRIEETISSKKMLASIGLEVKKQIDTYIQQLQSDEYDLDEISSFIKDRLNITLKTDMTKEKALAFLDRPLRVAGVVKNQGEPGGGPYVVDNGEYTDLQILEKAEINLNDESQEAILSNSEYFNPVDLVCFTNNYKGEKYNLLDFVNEDRYFISEKTHEGRPLKALEHPGLWNGAMHNWNTVFVEVPLSTFNPVKQINDLLKEGHKEKR